MQIPYSYVPNGVPRDEATRGILTLNISGTIKGFVGIHIKGEEVLAKYRDSETALIMNFQIAGDTVLSYDSVWMYRDFYTGKLVIANEIATTGTNMYFHRLSKNLLDALGRRTDIRNGVQSTVHLLFDAPKHHSNVYRVMDARSFEPDGETTGWRSSLDSAIARGMKYRLFINRNPETEYPLVVSLDRSVDATQYIWHPVENLNVPVYHNILVSARFASDKLCESRSIPASEILDRIAALGMEEPDWKE